MTKLCESNEGDICLKVLGLFVIVVCWALFMSASKIDDKYDAIVAQAQIEHEQALYESKLALYDKLLAAGTDPMEAGCIVNEPTPVLIDDDYGEQKEAHEATTACGLLMSQKQITNVQLGDLKSEFDDQLAQARTIVEGLTGELARVQSVMQDMSQADASFLQAIEGWTQQRKLLADSIKPKASNIASNVGG